MFKKLTWSPYWRDFWGDGPENEFVTPNFTQKLDFGILPFRRTSKSVQDLEETKEKEQKEEKRKNTSLRPKLCWYECKRILKTYNHFKCFFEAAFFAKPSGQYFGTKTKVNWPTAFKFGKNKYLINLKPWSKFEIKANSLKLPLVSYKMAKKRKKKKKTRERRSFQFRCLCL